MSVLGIGAILEIGKMVVGGVTDHFEGKRAIKKAKVENTIRLMKDAQSHNQAWEMKSLENAGWKDDVLFYAFIALFLWAGFDPVGAGEFFTNIKLMPEWFVKVFLWLVASVIGVKKIGDYAPNMIKGIKEAVRGK